MHTRVGIAVLGILFGALETAGGLQELIYQGILRSRTYPLIAGTLGTVAGAMLLATGIALLIRSRVVAELAWATLYTSVPVFVTIGIATHIAGWGITAVGILFPIVLVWAQRRSAAA
jgi:hypothetical protein